MQTGFGLTPKSLEAEGILRPECTGPAHSDQPALTPSETPVSDTPSSGSLLPEEELMELILHRSNLDRAWQRVKRNRGAPGPDGITIKEFEPWARINWPSVQEQLLDGTYQPEPVRRKTIKKEGGGARLLGIPTVVAYCTSLN